MIFFFRTNVLNICFSCPIPNMILFGVLRRAKVPPAYQVRKRSWKWIMWGGIRVGGFTGIHFFPQAKTLTTEYYIDNLLEKEVKPLLYRENHFYGDEATDNENCSVQIATWRSSKTGRQRTQPRPPKHGAKKTLPNVIEKTGLEENPIAPCRT